MQIKLKAQLSAYARLNVASPIEVVDNLTTPDATKALSANQGFLIKQMIDNLPTSEEVSELQSDVAVLDTQVQEVEDSVEDIQQRVEVLEDKDIVGEQDEQGILTINFR